MKVIVATLVVMVFYLQYSLWLSDHGAVRLWQMERTIEAQQRENKTLKERNQKLHAEVVDLKRGTEALEERARSELGMVKEGELFYQVIDERSGSKSTTSSE